MKITLDQIQKLLHYIKFRNIFLIHRVHKLHYRIKIRNYTGTSTSEINLLQDFSNSNPVHQVQKYIYSVFTWENAVVHPLSQTTLVHLVGKQVWWNFQDTVLIKQMNQTGEMSSMGHHFVAAAMWYTKQSSLTQNCRTATIWGGSSSLV